MSPMTSVKINAFLIVILWRMGPPLRAPKVAPTANNAAFWYQFTLDGAIHERYVPILSKVENLIYCILSWIHLNCSVSIVEGS